MTHEDTLRTLADILRECSHVDDATNPDTIRAALQRVSALASGGLRQPDLGVAARNAQICEAMSDTVDPPPLPGYSDTYYQRPLKRRVIE